MIRYMHSRWFWHAKKQFNLIFTMSVEKKMIVIERRRIVCAAVDKIRKKKNFCRVFQLGFS